MKNATSPCVRRPHLLPSFFVGLLLAAPLLIACGTHSPPADPKTPEEIKDGLERQRDGIKSLFVRYEEEALPLIDPDVAFRWDVMQFRMKTEEHEAIDGAKRYHRTSIEAPTRPWETRPRSTP